MSEQDQSQAAVVPLKERLKRFEGMWQAALPIISKIVPAHVDPARVYAIAMTARQRDTRLMDCTDLSVLRAAILSAQFGLDVSGIGGKAYMVPYWNSKKKVNEAQFQFGWRGLIELAMRTGRLAAIYAREVYAGEHFEYEDGLQQRLQHVPTGAPNQEIVAAWAVAILSNGYRQPEVMFRHQIDARRAVSKNADGPAWTNWFPEMAKKTVIRQLCKKLPDSPELSAALDLEDRADLGLGPAVEIDLTPELEPAEEPEPPPQTRTEGIKRQVRKSRKEREAAEGEQGELTEREPGDEAESA
jgi:recombination protein RecT